MTPFVPLMMFGWIPLVIALFKRMKPHHAVIAGFLLAWMFLPQYEYPLPGLPNYSKISAACYGILLASAIFNPSVFSEFKPSILDLPMGLWCFSSFASSVSNGLGAWDGGSAMLGKISMWGIPYFIGRLYFNRPEPLRDLVVGIFIGGLLYLPFTMYEVIMSPRLHKIIYGWHPHDFGQAKRGGGYRPVVFMQHGLMTAMWMTNAALSGLWLLYTGYLKGLVPEKWKKVAPLVVFGLLVGTIACKSTGALGLLFVGFGMLVFSRTTKKSTALMVLLLLPVPYVTLRGSGLWDGQRFIEAVARIASEERTGSLAFRLDNENILSEKAMIRPICGWGGWKRSFVLDENGLPVSVPDGLWILALGQNGILGLASLLGAMMVPQLLFFRRIPPSTWRDPAWGMLLVLPVIIGLYMVDNLFNNMFNPVVLLAAGGLTGLTVTAQDHMTETQTEIEEPEDETIFPRLL